MLKRVQVESYAGSRADERPRRVIIEGRKHVVARLLHHSIEEHLSGNEQTDRYKVLTVEGVVLELIRAADGEWFLESIKPAGK